MSRILLAIVLLPLLSGLAAAQDARTQADSMGDRIISGQSQAAGTSVEWGTATGVVARPAEDVLRVIRDYASYRDFMPHFRTSRVLARRGGRALIYFEVGIMRDAHTLWGQLDVRERTLQDGTLEIEARLMQGNMDHFRARWRVRAVDATRSLVSFRILVDPDLPLPASVFTDENVKAARRSVGALRQRLGAR
ncbi:MAG: SRPBCC family protein [Myxococcales bacterium]|nr:SRPBCC family protein [Myxococcales bacterium]